MIQTVLNVVIAIFPLSEAALAFLKRSRGGAARSQDRGSMLAIWISTMVGVALAVVTQGTPITRLPGSPSLIRLIALGLLVGGLAVRWVAILTLGRFFTVDIAVHADHTLMQTGLYRWVRHPSYTGLLIAFLGLGVAFANLLSIIVLLLPITAAILYRTVKEEAALAASLGPEYAAYCARTKRFVPGLF